MKIAIATCTGRDDAAAADAPLLQALEAEGVQAQMQVWNDSSLSWHRFDAVLIRTTWDWHVDAPAFVDWLNRVQPRTCLLNPISTLAWGLDKRYLLELAASDVPVVPTLAMAAPEPSRVRQWAIHHGYNELVFKPSLSAGSRGVVRLMLPDVETAMMQDWPQQGVRLVQPYYESVETAGEVSLIFFDGQFSHAVRKTPKANEYRIQRQYGGTYTSCAPDERALHIAASAVATIPGRPLIARIDMLHDKQSYRVIEAEVIEPDLYFACAPEAPRRLAQALLKRLGLPT
jgi:glutathione synthase/RimK-type ligase-like ATP-grasp enzyme